MSANSQREKYLTWYRMDVTEGKLNYHLRVFGDTIAAKQGYPHGIDGLEAIQLYLINKHHWLPRDVRSMSPEDIRFALTEEMNEWKTPKEAIFGDTDV